MRHLGSYFGYHEAIDASGLVLVHFPIESWRKDLALKKGWERQMLALLLAYVGLWIPG
jgi:hypothetical protein